YLGGASRLPKCRAGFSSTWRLKTNGGAPGCTRRAGLLRRMVSEFLPVLTDRHGANLWRALVRRGLAGCGVSAPAARTGRSHVGFVEPESTDALIHHLGLLFEHFGGCGIFLDQRRVLLRYLVH